MYKSLFEPIKIGTVELKNRIVMAPMGNLGYSDTDGCFNKRAFDYFIERAKGGVGLIITGVSKVENEIEKFIPGTAPTPAINPGRFIQIAGELTERVHAYNTKIFLQLGVGFGRVAAPALLLTHPVAPSPIPNYWKPDIICRELTEKEIETIIRKTAEAALIAKEAGFDGVEIHAVHEGYLLDQFAIALFNKRKDRFGGDLRGRLTFATEIVKAIKHLVGRDYPVSVRFSMKSFIKDLNQGGLPDETFEEKGRDVEEGLEAAKILEEAGYDALDVDNGSYDAWYWAHPPMYQSNGLNIPYVKRLKEVVKIPIMLAGKLDAVEFAAKVVNDGISDMVAIGRGLLTDPYWPKKVLKGDIEDIRPCIGCQVGCIGRIIQPRPLCCAVNPAVGREKEYEIKPAEIKKRVMVVGGGVAGMEAARVLALRGHDVELYEKNEKLGGHLIEGSVPDFKKDDAKLLSWYKYQMKKHNIKIYLNTEVTKEFIDYKKPDTIIIATGSEPIIPNIKGIDSSNVALATELLGGVKEAKDRVIVVGGGLVGCELALWLAKQGKKVTLIEMLNDLMVSGAPVAHANRIMLIDLLKFYKVEILTNTKLVEIKDNEVIVETMGERKSISVDTIALAVGYKSNKKLYEIISRDYPDVYLIGDSREPQNIMYAIWDAYEIARDI